MSSDGSGAEMVFKEKILGEGVCAEDNSGKVQKLMK